jgi:peptidoglycan/xylan/chitin deacetylase (PgdA/CDA1 family)
MTIKKGIFTISLDFELYWGMHDKVLLHEYEENLKGDKNAIIRILELFDKYEIHATWATVGFLFAKDLDELEKYYPHKKPSYTNANLSSYDYIKNIDINKMQYHFAPETIAEICKHEYQEIGTHTFSHYYCLENGQKVDEFNSDIESAIKIAEAKGISIKSLIFPRHQKNDKYLAILNEHGITSFRGVEKGWIYKVVVGTEEMLIRRGLRLIDAYINLSGANSYNIKSISTTKPYNIPSSRFLRPVSKKLFFLEGLRKRRILNAIKHAAIKGEIFHLWWHPHNFGVNTDENINFLEDILSLFVEMKAQYGMKSLNMGEITESIDI